MRAGAHVRPLRWWCPYGSPARQPPPGTAAEQGEARWGDAAHSDTSAAGHVSIFNRARSKSGAQRTEHPRWATQPPRSRPDTRAATRRVGHPTPQQDHALCRQPKTLRHAQRTATRLYVSLVRHRIRQSDSLRYSRPCSAAKRRITGIWRGGGVGAEARDAVREWEIHRQPRRGKEASGWGEAPNPPLHAKRNKTHPPQQTQTKRTTREPATFPGSPRTSSGYLYRGIVGNKWCSSWCCIPPHSQSLKGFPGSASRVVWNWALTQSGSCLSNRSSDWCDDVTTNAMSIPPKRTPLRKVRGPTAERKKA